jgi:peroxiredoxin (alkyl hydroperoxide reductase subunit C)
MFLALATTIAWPQANTVSRIPLIGEDAPAFTAQTTKGVLHFPSDYGKKWKILLSHPADFTPVCTSEILELALVQQQFKDLNAELAVLSTDDISLHKSWEQSMNELLRSENQSARLDFPLIDDSNTEISRKYGMLSPSIDMRHTVRGVFIIDPDNKIESVLFYPSNVGRNLEELQRTLVALQTAKEHAVLTPVNWKPGDDVLLPYPYPYNYYDSIKNGNESYRNLSWYMLFKKMPEQER